MLTWLRSWFARPSRSLPPAPEPVRPQWLDELLELHAEQLATLQREVLEAVQKQARAAAKQAARTETTLSGLDASVTKLTTQVAAARQRDQSAGAPQTSTPRPEELEDLFDALDALEHARELAGEPHLAIGLERVSERVLRFCARAGCTRVSPRGRQPDPRLVRVVGAERTNGVGEGRVTRVVRAAIMAGDRLVREGQVIVASGQGPEHGDAQAQAAGDLIPAPGANAERRPDEPRMGD